MNRMVNTSTDALTKRIQCPDINDVNFASKLRSVFETINDNFARLSNYDFIKGESGTSVYIKQEPIYNSSTLSTFGNKLKNYLESLINPTDKILNSDGIVLDYFGNFTPENAGSLQVIYNKSNDIASDDIAVSSLQYVFLDGRFWNDKVGKVDQSVYDGIEDESCIVIYDNNDFKSLNGALPTMYYERGVGLCWKLNGKPTGMPVQGIPGTNGKNALMRIVKVNNIELDEDKNLSTGVVTSIFEEKSGYINITEDIDIDDYANSSALIISSGKVYIGLLGIETYSDEDGKSKDRLIAICDPAISLNETITSEAIYKIFKKISLTKSNDDPSHLQGLFIPINASESEKSQSVHLISSSPIINTYDSDNLPNSDVLFTPVNDIGNIDPNEEKPLNVDKYLYLKVDNEYLKLSDFSASNNLNSFDTRLNKYNYCIKYKLIGIAKSKDNTYLQPNFSEEGGLCYTDESSNEIIKIDNNVIYTALVDGNTNNTDYASTLPNDLESNPFYIWEVQYESASYDIDELKAVTSKGNDSNPYADVPSAFKYICTRTITPGSSSKIHWFDALDIEKENDTTYSIPGWHESNHIFNFIKFVPVFKDESYHVNDDTAINFNYNVNITGCDHDNSEVKRNLSVHGDINCDNINIDGVVSSKEIDTIYTKNEIVGESGLKLCKDSSDNYQFIVDNDGNVQSKDINAANIDADNVTIQSLKVDNSLETSEFNLNVEHEYYERNADGAVVQKIDNREYVKINEISPLTPSLNASFNNVRNFDISGVGAVDLENTSKASISKMPMIFTNNGNIVVTNQEKNNLELYHYGVPVRDESGSTDNVSSKDVNFDNAKKFNMVNIKAETSTSFNSTSIESDSYGLQSYNNRNFSRDFVKTQSLSYKFSVNNISDNNSLIAEQTLNKCFLEKFTIDMSNPQYFNLEFYNLEPINIKLNHKYICHIAINGENQRGSWPTLHSDSYMKLKLYYKIGDSGDVIDSGIEKHYTIPTSPEEWTSTSAYNTNGTLEPSGGWAWRHRGFGFYAGSFQLNPTDYGDLFNSLKNKGKVTFWVFPEFYIYAKCSKGSLGKESCIKGLKVYFPMATKTIGHVGGASTLLRLSAAENGIYSINNMNNYVRSGSSSKISFTVAETNNDNENFNNIVICNDGVVLRSNESFIGLGYTNDSYIDHENYTTDKNTNYWTETTFVKPDKQKVPIICYYEFDQNQFTTDSEFTDENVAKKMMVIPIKDIFTAIKVLKTKFWEDWEKAEGSNIY